MSLFNDEEIDTPDKLLTQLTGRFADVLVVGRTPDGNIELSTLNHPSTYLDDLEKVVALLRES